jgi:negative regulator of genetic competence, sporulation and motility
LPGQWLEAITAVDLGVSFKFTNLIDFVATQEMSEEFTQEVAYHGAFGTDGPVLRRVRNSDEGTVTISVILTKTGVANKMNDEDTLRKQRDFTVVTKRGATTHTYNGCNWRRLAVRSTLDQVTLDADISVPGYTSEGTPIT